MPPVPRALREPHIEDFVSADERPENMQSYADDLVFWRRYEARRRLLIARIEWCEAAGVDHELFVATYPLNFPVSRWAAR
jgi:hypothetical protein